MKAAAVRLVALLIGVGLTVPCFMLGLVGPVEDAWRYREARPCPAAVRYAPAMACIGRGEGVVTSLRKDDVGADGHFFYADIIRASGQRETVQVDSAVYRAASQGDRVHLRLWHDTVAVVTVHGVTDDIGVPVPPDWFDLMCIAWIGIGVILWALLGDPRFERPNLLAFVNIAWLAQVLPNSILASYVLFEPHLGWSNYAWGALWLVWSFVTSLIVLVFLANKTD